MFFSILIRVCSLLELFFLHSRFQKKILLNTNFLKLVLVYEFFFILLLLTFVAFRIEMHMIMKFQWIKLLPLLFSWQYWNRLVRIFHLNVTYKNFMYNNFIFIAFYILLDFFSLFSRFLYNNFLSNSFSLFYWSFNKFLCVSSSNLFRESFIWLECFCFFSLVYKANVVP